MGAKVGSCALLMRIAIISNVHLRASMNRAMTMINYLRALWYYIRHGRFPEPPNRFTEGEIDALWKMLEALEDFEAESAETAKHRNKGWSIPGQK